MPVLRITKKYNNKSPLRGIVIIDKVTLQSKDDLRRFLAGIKKASQHGSLDWDVVDWEWALVDTAKGAEVLQNPTGGRTGKL